MKIHIADIPKIFTLFPNSTELELTITNHHLHCLEYIPKFKLLETLIFTNSQELEISTFTNFLKTFKENNLKIFHHPTFKTANKEEISEFYKTLFQIANLTFFEERFFFMEPIISSWIETNTCLKKLVLNGKEEYLDNIFDALSVNTSIETFNLRLGMNLKDSNSLKFIEKNSTLKNLTFEHLKFKNNEMLILNDCLVKNDSIEFLNLSVSNFQGPFEFLKKKNLKIFKYHDIWDSLDFNEIDDFLKNMKSNTSLVDLDLSMSMKKIERNKINELIEILKDHENIESISMADYQFENPEPIDFYKLLKNPKLKELKLNGSFGTSKELEKLFFALNENENLTNLHISNISNYPDWDHVKLTNKTLKKLIISGLTTL
jgi:hypothetical protein